MQSVIPYNSSPVRNGIIAIGYVGNKVLNTVLTVCATMSIGYTTNFIAVTVSADDGEVSHNAYTYSALISFSHASSTGAITSNVRIVATNVSYSVVPST